MTEYSFSSKISLMPVCTANFCDTYILTMHTDRSSYNYSV